MERGKSDADDGKDDNNVSLRGAGLDGSDGAVGRIPKPHHERLVFLLTLSAGIGGFLFGYDTGVISGALLYVRDEFPSVDQSTELQEAIVSMAILGAAIGASVGGNLNDRFGRKPCILMADSAFIAGALAMAVAPSPAFLIMGRVLVGLGVGIASMAVPVYIAESSPAAIRGALVSVNVLMITTGQFMSYVVNYAFTQVPGTWRWMLGVAGVPAVIQAVLMGFLPESPRWLLKQGRTEEAAMVTRKLNLTDAMEAEMAEYGYPSKEEDGGEYLEGGANAKGKKVHPRWKELLKTKEMRMALIVGVGLQVFQQLAGINTVMYYSPSIVELAGYTAHQTALKLSMLVALMNAIGTVVGIVLIDRCGRRKLILWSLAGVIAALAILSLSFNLAETSSPPVAEGVGGLPVSRDWLCQAMGKVNDCARCLSSGCGFCAAEASSAADVRDQMGAGTCLTLSATSGAICAEAERSWYARSGCPNPFGLLALAGLILYIIAFAPGMGPVPWAVNSEIYPLQWRGMANGIAATANWIANLLVAQTFLTLIRLIGTAWTFFMFMCIAIVAFVFIAMCLPETKGVSMQQMQEIWEGIVRGKHRSPTEGRGVWKYFGVVKRGVTNGSEDTPYMPVTMDEEDNIPGLNSHTETTPVK